VPQVSAICADTWVLFFLCFVTSLLPYFFASLPLLVILPPLTTPTLPRRLNLFDATMIVMGGIVGSGIFINPYVVALHVHTPFLILGVWILGGILALLGAFIWAELATRMPSAGGQYLYLREAYHPSIAFLYGWVLLLVTQTGGMAAVAVTFAKYFREISGSTVGDGPIAAAALLGLTAINCFGARAGSNVQNLLMLLKAAAIVAMVALGLWLGGGAIHPLPLLDRPISFGLAGAIGAAMIPIAFAYGGWQTATFVAGEMRDPRLELSRGLIAGVLGVVVLYLSVNFVCLRVLGPAGLAATHTPASAVMRAALGERGAQWIAVGIAISTLGFLSQGILTAPRVYYAMARDGLFFQSVGWLHPRTGAPVVAILIQGVAATIIALSGRYEQILNYVVSIDFISFALTAASLFVFRRREHSNQASAVAAAFRGGRSLASSPTANHTAATITKASDNSSTTGSAGIPAGSSRQAAIYRVPGHPYTTAIFVLSCAAIVASTIWSYPANSAFGFVILAAGTPVYLYWSHKKSFL
jgi:APA family basic amino acid/polyamine antiporter